MIAAAAACGAMQMIYGMQVVRAQYAVKLATAEMEAATGMASFHLGQVETSKPCRYCGRTEQTRKHHSCDGCGAPKETNHGK